MNPILCNYYITYRCNARCVFCDFWRKTEYRSVPDADIDHLRVNLKDLKRLGVIFIDFTGGEPLLHPQLPQILEEAKILKFMTSITTNCLLYPRLAEDIKGLVDFLHFSLDSPDEKENDLLRGVKCYDKVLESIELATSLHQRPDILFTVTNQNYQRLEEMARFAADKKLILIVNPVFSYFGNEPLKIKVIEYLKNYQHRDFVYINRAFLRLIREGGNDIGHPRCRAVSATVVISPQNQLLLPCFHRCNKKIPINGNLVSLRASTLVKSALRNQGRYPFCQGCTINCYFDPSFLFAVDSLFFESIFSKVKYGFDKYLKARTSRIDYD